MNNLQKIFALFYFIFALVWLPYGIVYFENIAKYHQTMTNLVIGLIPIVVMLVLSLIHFKLKYTSVYLFRHYAHLVFSFINVIAISIVFVMIIVLGECSGEGCGSWVFLPFYFFVILSSFLTLFFGLASLSQISKKLLFWATFLTVVLIASAYFSFIFYIKYLNYDPYAAQEIQIRAP